MTPAQRQELTETFLHAYREKGDLSAALEVHANAAVLASAGIGMKSRRPPSFVALPAIREACEMYGLTPKGMMCESREAMFVDCRAVAALALSMQGFNPRQIANALGRKDHTTALAAIRRASKRPDLKAKAEEISKKLAGSLVSAREENAA